MAEKSKSELKKVSYKSAVFVGVVTLVMYLILGIMQQTVVKWQYSKISAELLQQNSELAATLASMTPLNSLVVIPIIAGLAGYLLTLVVILVYNLVASKFPISWELKK